MYEFLTKYFFLNISCRFICFLIKALDLCKVCVIKITCWVDNAFIALGISECFINGKLLPATRGGAKGVATPYRFQQKNKKRRKKKEKLRKNKGKNKKIITNDHNAVYKCDEF